MSVRKQQQKQNDSSGARTDSLWRKPIALDSFEDVDPLETLYRGREVAFKTENQISKAEEVSRLIKNKTVNPGSTKNTAPGKIGKKTVQNFITEVPDREEIPKASSPKITESRLKEILKIKSETYYFTDLREILRGKSFEIYAYLCLLSEGAKVCKIKHLDLMRKLEISRPTLFKQGEWLTRLSLIEKRTVPGDHLGTSYTVHPLEEVLPISTNLIKQLELQIESFREGIIQ